MMMTRARPSFLCGVILGTFAAGASASDLKGLDADGPAASLADKLMLFGRLVGDWELDYAFYPKDGPKVTTKGEWHWGWALEGRAVVDVWICPSRVERRKAGAPPGEWGTTVRYYDPKIDAWHVVFVGPAYNNLNVFTARQVGQEIVMEGDGRDGLLSRWIFSDIMPASFHWRAVSSQDKGKTWVLREEMQVRRAGTSDRKAETDPSGPGVALRSH